MRNASMKKMLSLVLCMVLIAAMALSGCSDAPAETTAPADAKSFTFIVCDPEGVETTFEITSSAATVGDALLEEELIAGDESEYGLYVKTVNGLTLDFEADKMYWAFYIDGEYAMTGVDQTEITEGATYMFKAEAA